MVSGCLSWAPVRLGMGDASMLPAGLGTTPSSQRVPAMLCNEVGVGEPRDIVFEWVKPGDLAAEDLHQLADGNREMVTFHWNEATGELSYDTSAPTAVFSDLVASSPASARNRANCESR